MIYIEQNEKPVWQRWTRSYRALAYGITFFVIFAITCAEVSHVAEQLNHHGDTYDDYPTMQYKHVIGLLLFSSIATLLFCVGHFWISVSITPVISFILAVFWGTGAGLLHTGTPFRASSCSSRPASDYPDAWQQYADLCSRVVTMEALAWSLWAVLIILMFGSLIHKVRIVIKPTPEEMYFATPRGDKLDEEY